MSARVRVSSASASASTCFRCRRRAQRVSEFCVVERLPEAPGPVALPVRQDAPHPVIELPDRRDRRRGECVVPPLQRRAGWDGGPDRALDQVDVAFVLLEGNLDEDGVGVLEDAARLIERTRDLLEAAQHVAEPHLLRRVFLRERQEKRGADRLDGSRRIVPGILDSFVLEQLERELVVDQLPVGGFLPSERLSWESPPAALATPGRTAPGPRTPTR